MRLVRVTHRNEGLLQERRWVRRHLSGEHSFCQLKLLNSFSISVSLFIFWRNHTFGDSPNTENEQSTFKSAWCVRPRESFRSRLSFRFGCRAGLWDYSSHTSKLHPQCLSSEGQCCCYSPQKPFSQIGLQLEAYRKFSCFYVHISTFETELCLWMF